MTTAKKTTKKTYFQTVELLVNYAKEQGVGLPEGVTYDGLAEFVTHEVELLDNKAAAAAKRAADKKATGDALREKIAGILTGENQTIAEIVNAIGDANITAQMVTPRLTQLVDLGQAVRDQVTVAGTDGGKSRKISAYRLS